MNRSDFMMILLLLLVFSHANCGKSKDEKFVESTVYTEESFIANVPNAKHFVMFYAPWCGHCQRLKPVWDALTNSVSAEMSLDVVLAKVDCTVETKLCSDEGVIGYPTLKLYTPEKDSIRYKGARDLSALYKFVKTALTSAPETDSLVEPKDGLYELTKDSFDKHISSGSHFIMFYAPWCGHCKRLEPVWLELAKLHSSSDEIPDDVKISRVDCTENRAVCTEFDVRGYPTLLWFQDGNMIKKYQSIRELEYFEKFIEEMKNSDDEDDDEASEISHKEGLHELTQQNFKRHITKGHHFIMFYAPWCGHCRRLEPVWLDLAKSYIPSDETPDAVKISRIDCTAHGDVCTDHNVRGYPTLLWFENGNFMRKYQKSRRLEDLEMFVKEMMGLPVEREDASPQKSKPPPTPSPVFTEEEEEKDEGPVVQLNSNNFDFSVALDVTFVMFYTPWCTFCQRLAPTWEELAVEDFSELVEPVKIGRVDCTENSDLCRSHEVNGYPTLLLFKDGEVVAKYSGNRSTADLKSFVVTRIAQEKASAHKDEL